MKDNTNLHFTKKDPDMHAKNPVITVYVTKISWHAKQ